MAGPVATIMAKLGLDISPFTEKLQRATSSMAGFGKSMHTWANSTRRDLKENNNMYDSANAKLRSFNRTISDTANITRGIVISQTFYAGVGAIRDATNALWEFNKQLDYAHVTYSALFGDANLASDFMSVLQEHAIETIFNYQDLAGISKKLLAYGLEYENLMFIMEGLTNLGAMSGDTAALDRIALALGQIYTKGKLSAEEMRQLANAYVPITDIITEKFNLSEDDLKRVGDLNLPAEDVINAIVDYANENFGGVGDAAMHTITGLEAKIVDTLKTVGSEMLKPLTTAYKSFLAYISNGLEGIRSAFAAGGVGGVFEYLVPNEDTQHTIRIFVANIKNLFTSILSLGKASGQALGNFAQVFVAVFNAVVPAITAITNALAYVVSAMASTRTGAALLRAALVTAAGAFVIMRVQAISALVITVVTKAVNSLSKALVVLATVIRNHPILSLLSMLGIALVGVSVSSSSANSALSGFFDTLAGTGGSSSSDILQKTEEEIKNTNNALDQFNNRLDEGSDSAEDLEDAIDGVGSAAKKTRGLLSFDEVFKLNDSSNSTGSGVSSGVLDDIENLVGGLGSLGEALIPEIPDFSEYFNDFSGSLLDGLSEDLKNKIAAGGWGALIGAAIGGLIGLAFTNPVLGAKIGSVVGVFAGMLFDELEYAVATTATGAVAGVGAAIIKAFGGETLTNIFKTLATGSIDDILKSIAGIFSATGAKALLKGGIIGAVVGLFVDSLAHLLWSSLEDKFTNADAETAKVGQTIGSIVGTIIGGLIGGPAGALIGSGIGTFVGGFIGLFWEPIKQFFTDLGTDIGNWFVETTGTLGAWWSENTEGFTNWVSNTWDGISGWFTDTTSGFSNWWEETKTGFSTWWEETKTGFSTWWSDTWSGFSDWYNDTITLFSDWDSINSETLGNWVADTRERFNNWKRDTRESFSNWVEETSESFYTWRRNNFETVFNWSTDTMRSIVQWCSEAYTAIDQWAYDTYTDFVNWRSNTFREITRWIGDTYMSFVNWRSDTFLEITSWIGDTYMSFVKWRSDVGLTIANWVADALKAIGGFCIAAWEAFSDWFVDTKKDIAEGWNAMWDPSNWKSGWESVKSWFSNLFKDISDWFSSIGKSINSWWDGLWSGKKAEVSVSNNVSSVLDTASKYLPSMNIPRTGHASGGIFNREHIARFAEGDKAEMAVPLENNSAMQPFVDAISSGIVSNLAPIAASGNSNSLPPLYVGTLIADDRGIRELYNKFKIIQVQENDRRGTTSEVF